MKIKSKIKKVLPTRAELRRIRIAIINQLYDYRHLGYNTTFLTALFSKCTKRTVISYWKAVKAMRAKEANNDQNLS